MSDKTFKMVSRQQHIELRLKHAEQLLREYNELTRNLNPSFDIPKGGGIMAELLSLSDKTQLFID